MAVQFPSDCTNYITFFLFGCEVEADETLNCKKKASLKLIVLNRLDYLRKIAYRIECIR